MQLSPETRAARYLWLSSTCVRHWKAFCSHQNAAGPDLFFFGDVNRRSVVRRVGFDQLERGFSYFLARCEYSNSRSLVNFATLLELVMIPPKQNSSYHTLNFHFLLSSRLVSSPLRRTLPNKRQMTGCAMPSLGETAKATPTLPDRV